MMLVTHCILSPLIPGEEPYPDLTFYIHLRRKVRLLLLLLTIITNITFGFRLSTICTT